MKKFSIWILVLHLALIGSIGLDIIGFNFPLLRAVIAFLYLTFIPGALILNLLNVGKLNGVHFLMYSAGISIFIIMFLGMALNGIFSLLSVKNPLSLYPILFSLLSITLSLLAITFYWEYFQSNTIQEKTSFDNKTINIRKILLFTCIPCFALIAVYILENFRNNIGAIFFYVFTVILVLYILYDSTITFETCACGIFMISLGILLINSLISPYPIGFNIDSEYYFSSIVIKDGNWNINELSIVNSLLSITILGPVYSIIMNQDIDFVFKTIYPALYSLVCVIIFATAYQFLNIKYAFLSSFLFIANRSFSLTSILFRRELIVTIFLALLILMIVDKQLNGNHKTFLGIIFLLSLPVSHYGLTYIFLALFISILIIDIIIKKTKGLNIIDIIHQYGLNIVFKPTYLILLIIFCISWFIYIASGSTFFNFAKIIQFSVSDLSQMFLYESRSNVAYQTMGIGLTPDATLFAWLNRFINYSLEFFLLVGLIYVMFKMPKRKVPEEYRVFLIITSVVLIGGFFLPFIAQRINVFRYIGFTFLFLSPIIIIGTCWGWDIFSQLINKFRLSRVRKFLGTDEQNNLINVNTKVLTILSCITIIFFLLNIGLVNEIAKPFYEKSGAPGSQVLDFWTNDNLYFTESEYSAAQWLSHSSTAGASSYSGVTSDSNADVLLSFWYGIRSHILTDDTLNEYDYLYLRRWNVEKNQIIVIYTRNKISKYEDINGVMNLDKAISVRNKIFDDKKAQIFQPMI